MPTRREEMFDDARMNAAALADCPRHDFSVDLTPQRPLGKRWRCARCGGRVESLHKHWYEVGLSHGAASPTGAAPMDGDAYAEEFYRREGEG